MGAIQSQPLDPDSLLAEYADGKNYTDCYATSVPGHITLEAFIDAFYTTWLFRIERFLLRVSVKRPSTDEDVRGLAAGELERFAAWHVEQRRDTEILLCDFSEATRSWLMSAPADDNTTTLYFGSAVVSRDGQLGATYRALLGFHKLYARSLLWVARRRLMRR